MTRLGPRIALATLALAVAGCLPDFPLDTSPEIDLDERLLGRWSCVSPEQDSLLSLTFDRDPKQERVYNIVTQEQGKDAEGGPGAFISAVSSSRILNVPTDEDGSDWAFVRYSLLRENVLYLETSDEALLDAERSAKSSQEVRKILEQALAERDPFEPSLACVAVKGDKEEQK
jgi:hypothetical protein